MNNFDTPEEIEKRATQEDPIVMYLIVRESLEMSAGKIASQVGHAVGSIVQNYYLQKEAKKLSNWSWDIPYNYGFTEAIYNMMSEWFAGSYRKVVLVANDNEWKKVLAEFVNGFIVITDAGLTEIPAGSDTVIGLYPMRKSERPKIIKKLQVLK